MRNPFRRNAPQPTPQPAQPTTHVAGNVGVANWRRYQAASATVQRQQAIAAQRANNATFSGIKG